MMTNLRSRLWLPVLLTAVPAFAQLNPTVKVLPRATATVPAECDESVAPQQAVRVAPEEKAIVRDTTGDLQAPPSASLRGELRNAVEAAQQSYRDRFRDALTRSKGILTSYPTGAERSAATDVISVLDDVDKIWDFEFSSPTGAFFEAGSDVYKIASKYRGFEDFVRRQTVVDQNGIRFYPSRETRDFVLSEAIDRLARLTGAPIPKRPAPRREVISETPRRAPAPLPTTKPRPAPTVTKTTPRVTPRTTPRRTTTTTHRKAHREVTKEARVNPPPAPRVTRRTETTTPPPPKPTPPVVTETLAPVVTETHAPAPAPAPLTETTPTSTTTEATTTTASTTSAEQTTTTASTTSQSPSSETTATETTTTQPKAESRSYVIPLLLILVGLGVLVLLFRASS